VESAQQIQQQAHIHVVAKNLYNQDAQRTPVPYGMLDRRMVNILLPLIFFQPILGKYHCSNVFLL